MQTPEEFAWDVLDSTKDERMDSLIDLIRARDAEVAGRAWVVGFRRGHEVRGEQT